ncbi:MAG: tRNA threonylcarbamoyladenosine biosynthesis protein TsaE [Phycisphaerae bacterium]|nr:tRNA threonylcarbamoyladenosine biosynthesis protein TsaE [Phycisphaerae bacterium]
MEQWTVATHCVEETLALGAMLGRCAEPNTLIGLIGPLGAGKTHFVKGVAGGLGIAQSWQVNSPTFVLINEYHGRLPIFHIDAYRLNSAAELTALGFEEMSRAGSVVIIEWADRVAELLTENCLQITIEPTGETRREWRWTGNEPETDKLIAEVRSQYVTSGWS